MKKGLLFLLVGLVITSIVGCAKAKPEDVSGEEFFATSYYDAAISGKFSDCYDKFLADVSKRYIAKDDYISEKKTAVFESGVTPVGYTVTKTELLEVGRFYICKVDGLVKFTKNGAEETAPTLDYILNTGGQYSYLYNGIYRQKKFTMAQTDATNNVHCSVATITSAMDGIELQLDMKNDNPRAYSFGGAVNCSIILTVDGNSFTAELPAPVKIESMGSVTLTAKFPDAMGEVSKFLVSGIYSVDSKGNVIESGSGSYSVNVTPLLPAVTTVPA